MASQLASTARSSARIGMGTPTWPNHQQIFKAAGLKVVPYRTFNSSYGQFDLEATMQALGAAESGDLALLHACCHKSDRSRSNRHAMAGDCHGAGGPRRSRNRPRGRSHWLTNCM
ncbi:aminotransferase class I/II-fold pyridoxal phosphate-dependent enzyme [Bradyrhizobium sp. IC4060]|nr:aminotransferase class I/II-fold pyridoxal phosphate-dependent enzyme [Bradyrhizobium sp. IC4060]MCA1486533.1 aminotransferase class I/II-fold pyridoxal phosphate-dependent enzyme [Bradyrhizobium sp. IC4061]